MENTNYLTNFSYVYFDKKRFVLLGMDAMVKMRHFW